MKLQTKSQVVLLLAIVVPSLPMRGCISQEPCITLKNGEPKYILITEINLGKPVYFENGSDSRAGYKYRLVTTTSEIYNTIFLERLLIDIEESPVDVDYIRKIDLDNIFQYYKLSRETEVIRIVEWISEHCFLLVIGDKQFKVCIDGNFERPELTLSEIEL